MGSIIDVVLGKNKSLKHMTRDSDGDKVPDIFDCEPFNPNKQGVAHNIAAAIARKAGRPEAAERIEARGRERDAARQRVRDVNRSRSLQIKAAEADIRKKSIAVELVAEREESIKVARQRGIDRARRPTGIAAFTAGIGKLSKGIGAVSSGINKLSAATAPRRTAPSTRKKTTRFVPIKGKPGQFKKVTTRRKGTVMRAVAAAPQPKTMADLIRF